MAARTDKNSDFMAYVLPTSLLEDSIEWIASNLSPEDVFEKEQLRQWAAESGYVEPMESE